MRPSVALALGGGGARGLAHILMLEAFEEVGVRPQLIAGTSIGAVYGAAFAAGLSAAEIRAHTEEVLSQRFDLARQLIAARADPVQRLFNLFSLPAAFLKPEALLDLVLPSRMPRDFTKLATPLALVATDFYAQDMVVFTRGDLRQAIAASIALPVIFQPVLVDGRALMDGGLVNPLPFDLVAGHCDVSVAIDVSGAARGDPRQAGPGAVEAIVASSQILQRSIVREKLKSTQPDIYIDVGVDQFHVLEFRRFREVLSAAAPAKDILKRQLEKVMGSVTLPALPAGEPVKQIEQTPAKKRRTLALPGRKKPP